MRFLAVIPARGGSKSVPRKNIVQIEGMPLIGYSIKQALASSFLDGVIVSTDDPEIASIAIKYGATVPFLRPTMISEDATPMIDVLQHALTWSEKNTSIDAVVLLQPTSPMRTAKHIDEAISEFIQLCADTVVSVVKVPHQYSPESIYIKNNQNLLPYVVSSENLILRRQDKPVYFARNGPAILIAKSGLIRSGELYGEKCLPYEMTHEDSLDIDSTEDLEFFKYQMHQLKKANRE